MINVTCPNCSTAYELADEDAGTQAECACGQVLDIVAQDVATSGIISVACDGCGSQYELGSEDAGTQVACPCGHVITVPAQGDLTSPASGVIPVTCPGCASQYELSAEEAGTQVECPCGTVITVPDGSAATAPAEAASAARTGPIPVTCPSCGTGYELPPEDAGTQAECGCGQVLEIPASPPADGGQADSSQKEDAATEPIVIPVTCESCGAQYELGPEDAGTQAECACGAVIVVPAAPPRGRSKKKKGKRTVEIQRPEKDKAKSWRGPALIGGGTVVVLIALTVVLIIGPGTRPAGNNKKQPAALVVPEGREPADPKTWQGWVNESTVGIVIVRPKQMLSSPIIEAFPTELTDKANLVPDLAASSVEELVIIFDASAEEGQPPVLTQFMRFSDETKTATLRPSLLSGLLPNNETVSGATDTWFRGPTQGLCFPDTRIAVLAGSSFLEERIPNLHKRLLPKIELLKQIDTEKDTEDVNIYMTEKGLALMQGGQPEAVTGQLESLQASVSLSGSNLIEIEAEAGDSAAAETAEKNLTEATAGLKTLVEQSMAGLPSAGDAESKLVLLAKALIDGIKVYRTDAILTVQLRAPYDLAESLKQAGPELVALGALLPGAKPVAAAADTANDNRPASTSVAEAETAESLKPPSAVRFPIAPDERYRVFDKAQERFMELYSQAEELKGKIQEAEQGEKQKLRAQRWKTVREATGVIREAERLAVKLADGTGDVEKRLQARYLLAYMYTELNLHYEAGMLGAYVARNDVTPDSKRALQAAFISLSAWQNAYTEAPGNDRDGEREAFVNAASLLDTRWGAEPELDRIRFTVGQVLQIDGEHQTAGDWFAKVAEVDGKYADAQVAAGQAYWRAYKALAKEAKEWRKQREAEVIHVSTAPVRSSGETSSEAESATPEPQSEPVDENSSESAPSATEPVEDHPATPATDEAVDNPTPDVADDPALEAISDTENAEPVVEADASADEESGADVPVTSEPAEAPEESPENTVEPASKAAAGTVEEPDPFAERLDRLFNLADAHLEKGVALMQLRAVPPPVEVDPSETEEEESAEPADGESEEGKPEEAPIPPAPAEIVAAKITLADIRLRKGNGAGALELLQAEPWSVMAAITVEDETDRPAKGVQSRTVATVAYQILLRATVAERQLDQARDVMTKLEAVAGAQDARQLTAVYVQLGDELMEEVEAADEERAAEVRSSFGEFLSVMAERELQTFSSLLWMAETSTKLAETETTPELGRQMHGRAVMAYDSILSRVAKDSTFCSARTVSAIRNRLAKSLRRAGQYDRAIQLMAGLLLLSPNSYSMQFEAARAIEEWGRDTDDKDRLLEAIRGRGDSLWGWGGISVTLQRRLEADGAKPEYRDMMLEARYHVADCHRQWALAQEGDKKAEGLNRALQAIRTSAQLADSLDGEWWDRLDELLQTIQAELGETPKSIRAPADQK